MSGSVSDCVSPQVYLNRALDILQQHSVRREMLDWEALRSKTLAIAAQAQTLQDTYPAIRFALSQLGDRHSFLKGADKATTSSKARRRGLGFRSIDGVIVQVHPVSPAEQGGIQVGDKLEMIEGVPYAHWKAQNPSRIEFFQEEHIHVKLVRAGQPSFNVEMHSNHQNT